MWGEIAAALIGAWATTKAAKRSGPDPNAGKLFNWGSLPASSYTKLNPNWQQNPDSGWIPTGKYNKFTFRPASAGGTVPDGISSDDVVRDSGGNLLGWFAPDGTGPTDVGTRDSAIQSILSHPYRMPTGMTEGEKWLRQRSFFNSQDQLFSRRDAETQLGIRQDQQGDYQSLRRADAMYDQQTSQVMAQRQWQFARENAQLEGQAYRDRMASMFPGASTWDLLGSSGASSGTGPGSLPGLPGAPAPSMGTQRSGPDPAIAAAKLQSSNAAMQTAVSAQLQTQQMQLQNSIAQRNAAIAFMNTAIQGAKTPSEIQAKSAAAQQSLAQAGLASAQAQQVPANAAAQRFAQTGAGNLSQNQALQVRRNAESQRLLQAAQMAKAQAEGNATKYGKSIEQIRNNAARGDFEGLMSAIAGMAGLSPTMIPYVRKLLGPLFRKGSLALPRK